MPKGGGAGKDVMQSGDGGNPDSSNEVRLADLWQTIQARKYRMLLGIVAALLLASAYLFLSEPLYQAKAHLMPPGREAVSRLLQFHLVNPGREMEGATFAYDDASELTDVVFRLFKKNFKSAGMRRDFFDSHNLAAHYLPAEHVSRSDRDVARTFSSLFQKRLRLHAGQRENEVVTATFLDADAEFSAVTLNRYIAYVNKMTVARLATDFNAGVRARISELQSRQLRKLGVAARKRQDRIARLEEALKIARMLSAQDLAGFYPMPRETGVNIALINEGVPLYMRGAKALEAEIKVLRERASDEPFAEGLRDLQEEEAFLEGLLLDGDKLSSVVVDAQASIPYRPARPNVAAVYVLSTILGLVLGCFLVFVPGSRVGS